MVAYFGRCLIIISKDKIASYHIWKMVLQSFYVNLAANGNDVEKEKDYNTKTQRDAWNLKDRFEEKFQTYGQEVVFFIICLGEAFIVLGPNCELSERVNESSLNRKGCRKFWTIFVAIDMTRFEYQSECKFPKLPQSKKCAERQKTSLSREQDDI